MANQRSMSAPNLPEPVCRLGYTAAQVLDILGPDRATRFHEWMSRRTYSTCNRRTTEEDARGSGPHGRVVTAADLTAFLKREEAHR